MILQLNLDLQSTSYLLNVILFILLIIYISFDVNYFLRLVYIISIGRFTEGKKKPSDVTTITGTCFTGDLDFVFQHMNNARFVRELDFARLHYFDKTGLYKVITKLRGHALQTACSIRYRRTIPFLSFYKVNTKCLYWDNKDMYLEQQFITPDGFVRATVLSKQTVVKVDLVEVFKELDPDFKPEMTEDLKLWMESMEVSSKKLRAKKD